MRGGWTVAAIPVAVVVGCGSSGKPAAAPVSVRTVTVTPSATLSPPGLDANGRIACSHYDEAVTHNTASTQEASHFFITGTGNDGTADGAAAIEAWELGVVAGSKSTTPAILKVADAQLLKDPSGNQSTFSAALLTMRDACIGAGWTSTSTP